MTFNREKALKEADKLVAKGKDREAIAEYQKIVKADPRDLGSVNKIGDLYLKVGDKTAAVDCFAQVAERYASDGFNLRAIAMLKKCTRTDPTRWDFHERLADLNAQQGLANEAKASYALVAEHYLKESKHQKAREIYAKVAELEPDNLKNRLKLADLYLKDNQIAQALGEYQIIGSELAKKGMLDESLQVLEKALGLDPSNVQILRSMARTYTDMGRADDGIRFIRTKLQEKGGRDPDLLVVVGETYRAAGNADAARQAFDAALQVAPERTDAHVALYRLALELGDADGALARYSTVAERLLAEGKGQQVLDELKAILKVKDSHVPTLEKLLAVQVTLGADDKVQSDGMGKLSEAYIAGGRYADAERVLNKLVVKEPDVSQHAEKLEFVRAKLRSGAAAPPAPVAAPVADTSFAGLAESADSGFSMSFEEAELEATPSRADDRSEFIGERMAEADVFIKYGLVDKATEQLQTILARYPDDISTRQKLKSVLAEEGRAGEAVEQCLAIAQILRQAGDGAGEQAAMAEARQLDPRHPALSRAAAPAGPVAGGFAISFDEEPAAPAAPPAALAGGFEIRLDDEPSAPQPAPVAPAAADFEISLDDGSPPAEERFEIGGAEPADTPAGGEFEIALDGGMDESAPAEGEFEIALDAGVDEPARTDGAAPDAADVPGGDEFEIAVDDEAAPGGDFEIAVEPDQEAAPAEAGGFDFSAEAPSAAMAGGGDDDAFALADGGEPTGAAGGFGEPGWTPSESGGAASAEPAMLEEAPIAEPAVAEPAAGSAEEGLFGEEDDFFNFAEELNREMEQGEAVTEVARDQDHGMTLEQIVSGIQKGVAAQVDKEDYETHYNLGIAYKEMGLTDEAIGEFQYSAKDPARLLSCCILLGACFTEKGMPDLAIQWYQKGLQTPGITDEDELALGYEIALCREAGGDEEGALKGFLVIYGTNARYRDVAGHVSTLKQKLGR